MPENISVTKIREAYPRPVKADDGPDGYCVGGAFCKYLEFVNPDIPCYGHTNFPWKNVLADYLLEANPKLENYNAARHASDIVEFNDDGNFELAWKRLDEALKYGHEDKEVQNGGGI